MIAFSILTAVMMFVGANASNLICLPADDPLSRPDMLSLLDRLVDKYQLESRFPSNIQLRSLPQQRDPGAEVMEAAVGSGVGNNHLHLANLIRQCRRNATLYTIFGLDTKFKLLDGGGPRDEYEELEQNINKLAMSIGDGHRIGGVPFYSSQMVEVLEKLDQSHIATLDDRDIHSIRQGEYLEFLWVF